MSEVVVQISADEVQDGVILSKALEAFAKWSEESGMTGTDGDAPDIMMMTERSDVGIRRRLVFQDRDHAARFLVYWRNERGRARGSDGALLGV
ncbi:hypothetical protein GC169_06020 [bacterium]|nr:hypothetical protein [bacterium]